MWLDPGACRSQHLALPSPVLALVSVKLSVASAVPDLLLLIC